MFVENWLSNLLFRHEYQERFFSIKHLKAKKRKKEKKKIQFFTNKLDVIMWIYYPKKKKKKKHRNHNYEFMISFIYILIQLFLDQTIIPSLTSSCFKIWILISEVICCFLFQKKKKSYMLFGLLALPSFFCWCIR